MSFSDYSFARNQSLCRGVLKNSIFFKGIVYFVGYMNWSVAWLLCPLMLSVIREQYRSQHDIRRAVAKASATASDKDVILARLNDLPAWVFFPDVERCEWLNRIIKQVWPNANQFTRNLLKEKVEPNVQKGLQHN